MSLLAILATLIPSVATAGNGNVEIQQGVAQIDLSVQLDFTPTSTQENAIKNEIVDASRTLWDMTDGGVRLRNVNIVPQGNAIGTPDVVVTNVRLATSPLDRLGSPGGQILIPQMKFTGNTLAHELGHYAFGLGDEYVQNENNICQNVGSIFDISYITEMGECNRRFSPGMTCIMQDQIGTATELCHAANHDPVTYYDSTNGYCEPTTESVLTTQQTQLHTHSCWEHMKSHPIYGPVIKGTSPSPNPPSGFIKPLMLSELQTFDVVDLLADMSGSMNWGIKCQVCEACDNGLDDDGDGTIDESDCSQSRLSIMRSAASAWIDRMSTSESEVAISRFNDEYIQLHDFARLWGFSQTLFWAKADDLFTSGADGKTAIGYALDSSIDAVEANNPHDNFSRAILLFSDGYNNHGPEPVQFAQEAKNKNIKIYTMGAGEALNRSTLAEIAGVSGGKHLGARIRDSISTMAIMHAKMKDINIVVPKVNFRFGNGNGSGEQVEDEVGHVDLEQWAYMMNILTQ